MKTILSALLLGMLLFVGSSPATFPAQAGQGGGSTEPVGTFPCVSTDGTYTSFDYPQPFSPELPCNVDQTAVDGAANVQQEQRYFDIFAWQSFVAMMWPTRNGRTLQPELTSPGTPRWEFWKESYQVYRDEGQEPEPWNAPRSARPVCSNIPNLKVGMSVLYRTNKLVNMSAHATVSDEIDQAFTYPLVDQAGNLVRYEVLLNYDEFEYLVENQLYNINGQIEFSSKGSSVNFPSGDNADEVTGATELKMSWKVLTDKDPVGRYFEREAYVANPDGTCSLVSVGLVGMHISRKTQDNKQWIWTTIEQIDNVAANGLEMVKTRGGGQAPLRPSFYNPDCPTCPINELPAKRSDGTQPPTQATRVIPIEKNTAQLNAQVQALLREAGSVLQYYEVVGTQWPTDEDSPPANPSQFNDPTDPAVGQVVNKPGGKPHPVYLTNSTMETYLQKGNQIAQLEIQGFPFNETPIFGTESCMGCHYSAGVAVGSLTDSYGNRQVVYGPPSSADFSWLIQLKAKWKETSD